MGKSIGKEKVLEWTLLGRPKCPTCGWPLAEVYAGSSGYTGLKCKKCRRKCLVNMGTLEAIKVEEEAS